MVCFFIKNNIYILVLSIGVLAVTSVYFLSPLLNLPTILCKINGSEVLHIVSTFPSCEDCSHEFGKCPCSYDLRLKPILGFQCKENKLGHASNMLVLEYGQKLVWGTIYQNRPLDGRTHKSGGQTLTMIGKRRLDNLQWLLEDIIYRNIPGDFIETGVWMGGSSAFVAMVFKTYEQFGRLIWLADTFTGFPKWNIKDFPQDKGVQSSADRTGLLDVGGVETVQMFWRKLGLWPQSESGLTVEWLVGPFSETLPAARTRFTKFAMLRLDGDTYQSTLIALENLYPFLSEGGIVYIDDFTDRDKCKQAVLDFRKKENIDTPLIPVWHLQSEQTRGIWFMKKSSNVM